MNTSDWLEANEKLTQTNSTKLKSEKEFAEARSELFRLAIGNPDTARTQSIEVYDRFSKAVDNMKSAYIDWANAYIYFSKLTEESFDKGE